MIPTNLSPSFNAYVKAVLDAELRMLDLNSDEAVSIMLKEWAVAFDKLHAAEPHLSRSDLTGLVVLKMARAVAAALRAAENEAAKAKGT